MKSKCYFSALVLFAIFFFHHSLAKAQSCIPTNILYPFDWIFITDIDGLEDNAWDIEAVDDDDNDTIKDNGFVIAGSTVMSNELRKQAILIRLDPKGNLVWERTYGEDKDDAAFAVEQTSDGSLLVSGAKTSNIFGGINSLNGWIFKVRLRDGSVINGSEHEYGGTGNEYAFDIQEDLNKGRYIIAGKTGNKNNYDLAVFDSINGEGEYWVFAIDTNNYSIAWQNIYHGPYTGGSRFDFAHSLIIDHDGDYVVTGYCASCEPSYLDQDMVVKIDPSGGLIWKKNYGDFLHPIDRDQVSNNIIETFDGTSYGYLATGVAHTPGVCFSNKHDLYGLKLDGNGNSDWNTGCELNEGINFGGSGKEGGFCAVQTCDGNYIFVGDANSLDNEVSCNHSNTGTLDGWILETNAATGEKMWDESVGDSYDDQLHVIKRVYDGSYVMAGQIGTADHASDIYVAKFELSAPCSPPSGLSVSSSPYCARVSWNMDPCVANYALKYRKKNGEWTKVPNATSPYVIQNTSPDGGDVFQWQVIGYCSPNNSNFTGGQNFSIAYCGGILKNCNTCLKLDGSDSQNSSSDVLAIYPNPSDGSFAISLQLADKINQSALLTILDQTGRIVSSTLVNVENGLINQDLKVHDIANGFYWARIIIDGTSYQTKLVVQKS